jgi:hypothetical protein
MRVSQEESDPLFLIWHTSPKCELSLSPDVGIVKLGKKISQCLLATVLHLTGVAGVALVNPW